MREYMRNRRALEKNRDRENLIKREAYRDCGRTSQAEYQTEYQRERSHDRWRDRPFVAIDGEGITAEDGSHVYNMLAYFEPGTDAYKAITDDRGLSFRRIAAFLLAAKKRFPNGNFVIYGASYDFNMFLANTLTEKEATRLYKRGVAHLAQYKITYRPGKWLGIQDRATKESIRIYDVLPFFQSTFVDACTSWLKERFEPYRELIETNKAKRGSFTSNDNEETLRYNKAELGLLVMLCNELRDCLDQVDIRINRWDGPGAVAAAVYTREGIRNRFTESPDEVIQAARHAYYGGRFELFLWGHTSRTVWQYDIRSAYPSAMGELPDLVNGYWEHSTGKKENPSCFSMVLVKWESLAKGDERLLPLPLPYRTDGGPKNPRMTQFPTKGLGWYWLPEVKLAREYAKLYPTFKLRELEVWEWHDDGTRPFAFVEELYNKRAAMKESKNGAEKALKLALNSLYGKLAQRIGSYYDPRSGELRKPPYHCLEWAGYITSATRAKLMLGCLHKLDSVISFETDAIFVTEPIEGLDLTNKLGAWEESSYSSFTIIQSGFYWYASDGKEGARSRGVDRPRKGEAAIPRRNALKAIRSVIRHNMAGVYTLPARKTEFVTIGSALHIRPFESWGSWITTAKEIAVVPLLGSKRIMVKPLQGDVKHLKHPSGLYKLAPATHSKRQIISAKHALPWANDNDEYDLTSFMIEKEERFNNE